MLSSLPRRSLIVDVESSSPTEAKVLAKAKGMSSVDFYLDNRPIQSSELRDGQASCVVRKLDPSEAMVEVQGFDGTDFVARYLLRV